MIDRSPFGVFLLDDALRIHHVNPRARPAFPAVALENRDLRELVRSRHAPAEAEEIIGHYEHTLATGESYIARATPVPIASESSPQYIDWEIHRVSLPNGRQGVVCYFLDVTAHLVAQRRLRESTDRLEVALAAAKLGLWTWDAATDLVDFPDRAAEIFGIERGPTMTWTAMQGLLEPADAARAKAAVEEAVARRTDYEMEYRVNRRDGTQVHVSAVGRPVFAADGGIARMIGVVQDITTRKQAEFHLRTQRDVLEQIVTGVSLPEILEALTNWVTEFAERKLIATILLLSEDGRRLQIGAGRKAPAAWSSYVDGQEIGPAAGSCGSAAYRGEAVMVADIAVDSRWTNFKTEALRHGLRACWSTPIPGSDGTVLGTFAIYYPEPTEPTEHEREIVDVVTRTASIAIERKCAEEALKQSRARLQEHAELLERTVEERTGKLRETIGELEAFSYSISHDMRAPLRSMYGYAELVIKDFGPKLPPEGIQYLRRISKNAARLELLVRDVLAYSKVAKADIALTTVDLDAFVPGLVGQLPELQQSELKVTVRHPLPIVHAHEAYLSQIFTNLVGNSIKFVRPGVPPEVEISAVAAEPGFARIEVRDNGIGIEPDHFSRIFEIFGRVYPDKKYEGTGIGLSIVKKAVQRMGGTIGVESTLGAGATFWFTLQTK